MSCLRTGDFGGAHSYLRRGIDLRNDHVNSYLGLALVYLKRQDTNETLKTWFQVLDLDPATDMQKRSEILKNLKERMASLHILMQENIPGLFQ